MSADQTTPGLTAQQVSEVRAADRRDRKDYLARLIGTAIWRPQSCMSGDIWSQLGPLRRRGCEDAAEAVMEFEDAK